MSMSPDEIKKLKIEFNKALGVIRNGARHKACFHPTKSECDGPFIKAHSLQRQGALKILEHNRTGSSNMYLYAFTEREHNGKYDFLDFKPIGRKDASTFYGFCKYHDTELFKTIENDPEATDINSDEHCFLHSYRSFAHSYHRKHEELKLHESDDEKVKEILGKLHGSSLPFIKEGVQIACNDLIEPKKKMNQILVNKSFNELQYLAYEYYYTVPIACASSASPSFYPNGEKFNYSIDPNFNYRNIFTTILPFKNRSIVILAGFCDDEKVSEYFDQLEGFKYELERQKALSFHVLSTSENCYLSPKYYEKKSIKWRKEFSNYINEISRNDKLPLKKGKKFGFNFFGASDSISTAK